MGFFLFIFVLFNQCTEKTVIIIGIWNRIVGFKGEHAQISTIAQDDIFIILIYQENNLFTWSLAAATWSGVVPFSSLEFTSKLRLNDKMLAADLSWKKV